MELSCTEQPILILVLSKFQISKHQNSGPSTIQIQAILDELWKFNRSPFKTKDARELTVTTFTTAKVVQPLGLGMKCLNRHTCLYSLS